MAVTVRISEAVGESREVAEWDWVVTRNWNVLHAPDQWDDPHLDMSDPEGRTACGIRGLLLIPGVLTRMGAPRCRRCCRARGLPDGEGSPKNDPLLRLFVQQRLIDLAA